jgi:hypothetical protein
MHRSRIQGSSGRAISWWGISRLTALSLVLLLFASAVRGAEEVERATFDDAPIDESAADMAPPEEAPPAKGSTTKRAKVKSGVIQASAISPPLTEAPLPDELISLEDGALSEETPEGDAPPPKAKGAPGAKAKADTKSGTDAKLGADGKPAPRERLVVGDGYTLEVKRGGVTQSFGGNLLKATEKWIVLRRMATGRNDYGVPLLSALPKFGNYFRRSYESLVEDDLWIPREAATIVSHRHVDTTAAARHIPANEPPPKAHCAVGFVQGEKVVRRDAQLSAIDADHVTLLLMTPFHSQYQQQISRGDILCISIPVVLSNVRMTHRDTTGQAKK